ncbi:hypothetical protein BGX31_008108 [Mortierella sp. GBA43]|nr:hypothetical protein BGX31_008108 [Mortierella sp. GBA43]
MGNGSSRNSEDLAEEEGKFILLQFKMHRIMGKGSFGKVRMVERQVTGKMYALKYISKEQVIKMDAVKNILREREILESVDHAFVVNMRFAFQDDDYMYMCMDLMMGGDLRFHMNRRNFNEDVVRFWIAEISSAVNHLHSLGIVHRDIKPDNILLDQMGHAHITDFNISCKLTPEKPFLVSQSGTVAYMAPEVFKGTGYGTSVDWWALGVLFYECIYNRRPFTTDSIPLLKRAISNQTIEYLDKENVSPECVAVIKGFLERDPSERLGARGGMYGIRCQQFFWKAALDLDMSLDQWWRMLETKQLTPRFQPPAEAANFDATYDLEELLMDDDPLTYQSTRRRQREKERARREQEARLKAEHDAALAATLAAEVAMDEMNRKLEEGMRKAQKVAMAAQTSSRNSVSSLVGKKKSRLQLFGSGDSTNGDRQPTIQTQPPPKPQPRPQSNHTSSSSQISRQTQFQSIPLSPVEAPDGLEELPVPPIPSVLLQSSPPDHHYRPPATKPPSSAPISRNESAASIYQVPQLSKPTPPSKVDPKKNDQIPFDPTLPRRRESSHSTKDTEAALSVRPSTPDDPPSSQEHAVTLQQLQHPFQAAHPQKAISSPVIIPTPQDHSVSRQRHIPSQQPLPPLRHQTSQPLGGIGSRRPTSPLGPAVNIEAEAAAMADMTPEQKKDYQMELIEREFTTFDYTVYESYHGLVDPVTMSVGNPPEWVRSLD